MVISVNVHSSKTTAQEFVRTLVDMFMRIRREVHNVRLSSYISVIGDGFMNPQGASGFILAVGVHEITYSPRCHYHF